MEFTDLIFDLYGTLVDIHTEENEPVWEKTALFFSYHGAPYTGVTLQAAFRDHMAARQAEATYSYECFPDIPAEEVFAQLFREKLLFQEAEELGIQAARLFRICATEYIRLYPGVSETLRELRHRGYRLWLLSNAQSVWTRRELQALELGGLFHKVYLSSDYGCRKPDERFLGALLDDQRLDPQKCLMIGNDLDTDIRGAKDLGLATLYLHTNITPGSQRSAKPGLTFGTPGIRHWEQEGSDLSSLLDHLPIRRS